MIYRDVHPFLKSLHSSVIIPEFPELTEEQAKNPKYRDIHDYTKREFKALSKAEQDWLVENSPSTWIQTNLSIRSKTGDIIPFKWNIEQWIMFFVLREFWRRGMPVRIIVLKGRQFGSTTFWTGILYYIANKKANTNSLLLAHDKETSEKIFHMFATYQENNPLAFKKKTQSKGHMSLRGINSNIYVGTGYSKSAGVGTTPTLVLGEEVARWKDGAETAASLLPSIPKTAGSMVVYNSTAWGHGNFFHNTWRDSRAGKSAFKGIFLPWFLHEEYRIPFGSREEEAHFANTLTEDEVAMKRNFGIDNAQLRWRRDMISEFSGENDPEAKFCENFPSTDTEPFLTNSSNFFDNLRLHKLLTELTKRRSEAPPEKVMLVDTGKGVTTRQDKNGWLEIYDRPVKGRQYVVSLDTSLGKEDGDPASLDVIDVHSFTQVAHFNQVIPGEAQAARTIAVAKLYNNALVAPERNYNPYVTDVIRREYGKVYRRKKTISRSSYDDSYGWVTTETSKMQALERLRSMFNSGLIGIYNPSTIEEMMSFGYDGNKIRGQRGQKDDRVMSLAIAAQVAFEEFFVGKTKATQIRTGGKLV